MVNVCLAVWLDMLEGISKGFCVLTGGTRVFSNGIARATKKDLGPYSCLRRHGTAALAFRDQFLRQNGIHSILNVLQFDGEDWPIGTPTLLIYGVLWRTTRECQVAVVLAADVHHECCSSWPSSLVTANQRCVMSLLNLFFSSAMVG